MSLKKSPAIELSHIHFVQGGQEVLCDITTSIPKGSYVGIVGPNGGGKTSLLKLILGIYTPNVGTVRVLGQDPIAARRTGRIGYVPQRVVQADFSFPATVEEVVRDGTTASRGLFARSDASLVTRVLETAGIAHLRSRLINDLSGGERQKAFIARALAAKPDILILDEPTTGVDSASQEEFYALLRHLHKAGMTILFVSHDVEVMAAEASTILCLNKTLAADCAACDFQHTAAGKGPLRHIHHHHH
jgi:zinc transport system ATP-binding protein